jgi:hypothetical protein
MSGLAAAILLGALIAGIGMLLGAPLWLSTALATMAGLSLAMGDE